jgi:hypothetical protein
VKSDALYNYLIKVRTVAVMNGLQPISAGVDIAYEAGRRIGVREGMDVLLKAFIEFHDEQDTKDKEL